MKRGIQKKDKSINLKFRNKFLKFRLWRKVCENSEELHWDAGSELKNEGRINNTY